MAQQRKTTQRKKTRYTKRAQRLQREAMYSGIAIALFLIFLVNFRSAPKQYQLVIYRPDASMETVQYYTGYKTAKREMDRLIAQGEYNPAILDAQGNIVAIRYGVVNFRTKTCGENTAYQTENGESGYTNGCYGADGAYLETDDSGQRVRFKQSSAVGWVDINEVIIHHIDDKNSVKSINHYRYEGDQLVHYGTTDMSVPDYAISLSLGTSETPFPQGNLYSYDGHYFYESYVSMIDDYRNRTYEHSLNASQPHYNYYQFLSHRSKSAYISKDLNWYISAYLGFSAKPSAYPAANTESQLFEEGYAFVDAQNTYGVNAMMTFALALNESGLGKSEISITKNNLFGHAAYDYAPDESANGYESVSAGITTHASVFLNKGYLNPCDQSDPQDNPSPNQCYKQSGNRYRGGYFGDKGSGMNIRYASDPYWGEKAAQYYRNMDTVLGGADNHRYQLVVLHNRPKTALYAQPSTSGKVIFYSPPVEDYALILLGEISGEEVDGNTTWYKVQSDGVLNTARNALIVDPDKYHPNSDVVYIPAAYFETTPQ